MEWLNENTDLNLVHYLNPRKGTETLLNFQRTGIGLYVHYLNPRKGTETFF